jgi:exopolysaccharide biosynthesis polyprenyl glycosylphosphotransferase
VPRCLGTAGELERVLHDEAVDQVLFFPPLNDPALVGDLLDQCEAVGVPAAFAIDMLVRDRVTPRVISIYGEPFVAFESAPKAPEALAAKHTFDVLVAGVALVALLPLLLFVSLAILFTMGRPVIFAQERVGLFGRRFRMIKFRSMVRDAEHQREAVAGLNELQGPVFKARDDPRVTWIGRLLRRTSLDELPQLLNVLRGQMSLVGPRPLPVPEQQQMHGWQRRRLSMKPGITGLWQVSGRSDLGFEEWMRLDLKYVDEWSFRTDLWLLLKTIPHVLWGKGAR